MSLINQNINDNWSLCKSTPAIDSILNYDWSSWNQNATFNGVIETGCTPVDLPHTWNNIDGQDGGEYFRGTYWYTKDLPKITLSNGQDAYLEFEGASSIAEVYVNGKFVTRHEGGFATFRAKITELLRSDEGNKVAVKVDNIANTSVYPQKADFTFFGGIYRDVSLIVANKVRFNLDHYGDEGVKITPIVESIKGKSSNKQKGKIEVDCDISNYNGETIKFTLKDQMKKVVFTKTFKTTKFSIPELQVYLWDGIKNPYLYTAEISILDNSLQTLDSRKIKIGFRNYNIDPNEGFILNGNSYPLRGVNRHQDRFDKGWAISNEDRNEDMDLIREIGANSIRLAHYQHDQYFYDLCDEYGMTVWAEIPYISQALADGDENTHQQMTELINQNYNHPSIVVWGLSNEITVGGYSESIYNNHVKLNDLVHELDSTRLTTLAQISYLDTTCPLNSIPDVLGYNHYYGWYVGDASEYGVWLDDFHAKYPETSIGLSEYGCEAILKWHSEEPKRGDYSEEYQATFHETVLDTIESRKYVWCSYVWNMFDFASDSRDEGGVKGRNNKGLVTYDRKTKKDSFYAYKAHWSEDPFVHITAKRFIKRNKEAINVKVYSNQDKVKLYVNNTLLENKKGKYVFEFTVPLGEVGSITTVKAESKNCEDDAIFERVDADWSDYILGGKIKEEEDEIDSWFAKIFLTTDRSYYSVLDNVKTIKENEEASTMLIKTVEAILVEKKSSADANSILSEADETQIKDIINKMEGIGSEEIEAINDALQTIKKE